jgi:hypothetical protein
MDEENDFSGAEPAKCTLPLRSSRRADRKTYMVRLIWSPDELIMNFEIFSLGISCA